MKSRQQTYRERMKARGFRQVNVWVHDDDRDKVREFAELLFNKRREAPPKAS